MTMPHQNQQHSLNHEISNVIDLFQKQTQTSPTLFEAQILNALQDLKEQVARLEASQKG